MEATATMVELAIKDAISTMAITTAITIEIVIMIITITTMGITRSISRTNKPIEVEIIITMGVAITTTIITATAITVVTNMVEVHRPQAVTHTQGLGRIRNAPAMEGEVTSNLQVAIAIWLTAEEPTRTMVVGEVQVE